MTWRPAVGWPAYEVSDAGEVRRVGAARPLRPRPEKKGYLRVALHAGGASTRRDVSIHSLVLEAFVGPRPPGAEVDHGNGVKTDNRLTNLEWVTPGENVRRAHELGLMPSQRGELNGRAVLTAELVEVIRASPETGPVLAARYGVSRSLIGQIRRREVWA